MYRKCIKRNWMCDKIHFIGLKMDKSPHDSLLILECERQANDRNARINTCLRLNFMRFRIFIPIDSIPRIHWANGVYRNRKTHFLFVFSAEEEVLWLEILLDVVLIERKYGFGFGKMRSIRQKLALFQKSNSRKQIKLNAWVPPRERAGNLLKLLCYFVWHRHRGRFNFMGRKWYGHADHTSKINEEQYYNTVCKGLTPYTKTL